MCEKGWVKCKMDQYIQELLCMCQEAHCSYCVPLCVILCNVVRRAEAKLQHCCWGGWVCQQLWSPYLRLAFVLWDSARWLLYSTVATDDASCLTQFLGRHLLGESGGIILSALLIICSSLARDSWFFPGPTLVILESFMGVLSPPSFILFVSVNQSCCPGLFEGEAGEMDGMLQGEAHLSSGAGSQVLSGFLCRQV